jgi:hypothetical protein
MAKQKYEEAFLPLLIYNCMMLFVVLDEMLFISVEFAQMLRYDCQKG